MAGLSSVFEEARVSGEGLTLRLVNGEKAQGNVMSVGDDYVVIQAVDGRQSYVPFTGIAEVTSANASEFRFTFVG